MTGHSGYEVDLEAMQAGAVDYINKADLNTNSLERTIRYAIKRAEDYRQLTEKIKANERMRIEKEAAQTANSAKSNFLANMSHEIRTPLGAVLGFVDLSLEPNIEHTERNEWLRIAKHNAEHLLTLINEILDLSKVEADCLQMENAEFDFEDLLEEVASLTSFQTQQKKIAFDISSKGLLPKRIQGDRLRIKQILINVLGNAVKFTERGDVSLSIAISQSSKDAPQKLTFRIRDSGIGISTNDQAKLFLPFSQVSASTARKYGGTGLGLVLSKKIAQIMNGDLILEESKAGVGSVFRLEILIQGKTSGTFFCTSNRPPNIATPDLNDMRPADLSGAQILVVDDSPDNQRLVSLYLKRVGAEVTLAENGRVGLKKALNGEFDVVLLDIQMPEMDGHETLQLLKQNGYEKPVIALTAHAMKKDRDLALSKGFAAYLTKPIDKRLLYETISKLLKSKKNRRQRSVRLNLNLQDGPLNRTFDA